MLNTLKKNPLVLPIRRKVFEKKFSTHRNVNYFRGVFHSFAEAVGSAPASKPTGYDNEEAASMYKERIVQLFSTDYPVLFWMEKIRNEFNSVFDFGGHIGIHYYSYQKAFSFSSLKKWTICDVEKVCEEGEKFAQVNDHQGKLSFVTDISHCEGYELLLANGSLQYVEWELHHQLQKLRVKPKYLIVNMTPLHPQYKTITLNNIGTAFCAYYLRKERDFFQGLAETGYQVLDLWMNEEKKCHIAFETERSLQYFRGAILKLKSRDEA